MHAHLHTDIYPTHTHFNIFSGMLGYKKVENAGERERYSVSVWVSGCVGVRVRLRACLCVCAHVCLRVNVGGDLVHGTSMSLRSC